MDETTQRRLLAEKTRLDPPPEGFEWNLGYDGDNGERAPERDMLVRIEQQTGGQPDRERFSGLHRSSDETPESSLESREDYEYGGAGHGVHRELVDAVLERWAGLDAAYLVAVQNGDQWPSSDYRRQVIAEAAHRTLTQAGTAHVFDVRNLARLAALTVAEELFAKNS